MSSSQRWTFSPSSTRRNFCHEQMFSMEKRRANLFIRKSSSMFDFKLETFTRSWSYCSNCRSSDSSKRALQSSILWERRLESSMKASDTYSMWNRSLLDMIADATWFNQTAPSTRHKFSEKYLSVRLSRKSFAAVESSRRCKRQIEMKCWLRRRKSHREKIVIQSMLVVEPTQVRSRVETFLLLWTHSKPALSSSTLNHRSILRQRLGIYWNYWFGERKRGNT